jgi:hypothetical protein
MFAVNDSECLTQSYQPIQKFRILSGNAPKFCQNPVNPDVMAKNPVSDRKKRRKTTFFIIRFAEVVLQTETNFRASADMQTSMIVPLC